MIDATSTSPAMAPVGLARVTAVVDVDVSVLLEFTTVMSPPVGGGGAGLTVMVVALLVLFPVLLVAVRVTL